MHFWPTSFAVALLARTAVGVPTTSGATAVTPPSLVESSVALQLGDARPGAGPHPDEIDILLLLCKAADCNDCNLIDLMTPGFGSNTCFSQNFAFVSVAVIQPNAPELPFNTSVGPFGCPSLLRLPEQNMCFNVNSATPFEAFALVQDRTLV